MARKREQIESELSSWSNMKFYAREQECKEKRRQLEKIEKKIVARKREQDCDGKIDKQKKRRKLEHAIIEESWGSSECEREQGSLAGKNTPECDSDPGVNSTQEKYASEEDRVDPLAINTQVGKNYGGEEQKVEQSHNLGKQPQLTKWFMIVGEPPEQASAMLSEKGPSKTGEPSGEKECDYFRGVCKVHKRKGEKFVVTKTEWKDRGGGRGYGNVYRRIVRYKCRNTDKILEPSQNTARMSTLGESSIVRDDVKRISAPELLPIVKNIGGD